jgi:outer membrane receptor protein involved in Fe transport
MGQTGNSDSSSGIEEVVVTAQRREEKLSQVPISVSVFSQQNMDRRNIRSIDDISRLTPGITFARGDARNAGASSIAIRGISSTVAASTTGIYLDDTPIQTRIIGAGASGFNTYPAVFDLERVEVLRGPQGTLFGAGSEGGTIRFITPKPDFEKYSAYARGEAAFIEDGATNYEAGLAVGGPVIKDKLAFRLTGWMRRDGGYIDRVNTDPKPGDPPLMIEVAPNVTVPAIFDADPSTPPTILPARRTTSHVVEKNSNYKDSRVFNAALAFAPADNLTITASVHYQKLFNNDSNAYWLHLSDPANGQYRQSWAMRQPSSDRYWLPSLKIDWDFGPARLVSSTSYFDRHQSAINDYSVFESELWAGFWEYPVGMFAPTTQINNQRGWTQELRLESTAADSRFKWVAGFFYQKNRQESKQFVEDTFLPNLFFDVVGVPFNVVFGQGLVDGLYTFNQNPVIAHDEQYAGFANIDFNVTDQLKLSAGVRVAKANFDASATYNGPVVGPPVQDSGKQKETPVTPRFGVTYQHDENNMLYATVAKGYRIGGYNPQVGTPCIPQLLSLGYSGLPGNITGRPTQFDSDTLWSYEIGSKNLLFNRRLRLATSVYLIDWDNIQQGVALTSCGFTFTINQGKAQSKGFDVEAAFSATDQLVFGVAAGYNDARFKKTVFGGPQAAVPLVSDGDHIAGAPWTVSANGQYDFDLLGTEAYIRFDYEYHSRGPDDTPALDPANRSPVLPPLDPQVAVPTPATSLLSLRAGTTIGNADISVFVRNLTNENPRLIRAELAFINAVPYGPDPHNYTGQTFVPRTVGATVTYRY